MKEVKLVLIVVRYFLPESGVTIKLLEFISVLGETAEILSKCLLSALDYTKLKLIGFCADNCNTNLAVLEEEDMIMYSIKLRITLNETLYNSYWMCNSYRTQVPLAC